MYTQLYLDLSTFIGPDEVGDYDTHSIRRDYFAELQRLLPDGVWVFMNGQVEVDPAAAGVAAVLDFTSLQRAVEVNMDSILSKNEVHRA